MIKYVILIFVLVLFFSGCGGLGAPFVGQVLGGSVHSSTTEEVYITWNEKHNLTEREEIVLRMCQLYDNDLIIPIEIKRDIASDMHFDNEMHHYGKHIKEWGEYYFENEYIVESIPMKEFLLREDCDQFFYAQVQHVGLNILAEENKDKREITFGMLDPTLKLMLFDKDRNLISETIYESDGIRIDQFEYARGRHTIFKEFGYFYLSILHDFDKSNER